MILSWPWRPFLAYCLLSSETTRKGPWMALTLIKSLTERLLKIPTRLQNVVNAYLLMLMLETDRHTQTFAEMVTGIDQTSFSRLLKTQGELAKLSLEMLATSFARMLSENRPVLVNGAPWTVAIIIDATLHKRSSLHVGNSQRFNHGQGFVVGHQWTNIVLYINGMVVPLSPIPFWSRNECKRRKISYKTEHERLREYLEQLNLAKFIGFYDSNEIVVMMDSGYDDKVLQEAVLARGWDFLTAIKRVRSVRTLNEKITGVKKGRHVDEMFRAAKRQSPWQTVRVKTDGGKKRRKFRVRKLTGYLKGVSTEVALVCSEKSGRTKGRRYFACSKARLDVGVIVRAYSLRWAIEMFHRTVKQQLGLEDAAVQNFDALTAHLHWVYCAYLILHELKIGQEKTLLGKQRALTKLVHQAPWEKKLKKVIAAKNQFGGMQRQERLLNEALQDAMAA